MHTLVHTAAYLMKSTTMTTMIIINATTISAPITPPIAAPKEEEGEEEEEGGGTEVEYGDVVVVAGKVMFKTAPMVQTEEKRQNNFSFPVMNPRAFNII